MMSTNDDKGDDDADDSQWYTMRMGDRMMAISDDADDDNDTDDDANSDSEKMNWK